MSFLVAIQHGPTTYIAGPTHKDGVAFGYSHIIQPKSGTYIMGILSLPETISALNKAPITINDDITINNYHELILSPLKRFGDVSCVVVKSGTIFKVEPGVLNISGRFACVGDRSIFGSLHATDRFNMNPEDRIKLALETIGEVNFEIKTY